MPFLWRRHKRLMNNDPQHKLLFISFGFTLVEVIVAVAIVGILSGIAYPLYTDYVEQARITKSCAAIQIISIEISRYVSESQRYPESLNEVGYATLLDPWGHPYQYINIQTAGDNHVRKNRFMHPINTYYDLCSMGKDGQTRLPLTANASRDDIIRANDGAFCGLASDF
jgi:general secretion pathway protein G